MSTSQKQLYFYSPEGLALVRHSGERASVLLRAAGLALTQQDEGQSAICAVDGQGSVLQFSSCSLQYTVYGHDRDEQCASALRYSGQRKESITGHYLLGDGCRGLNPLLMRFNSPDNLSPFGMGGINAYCYCSGDPVNNVDPSGHVPSKLVKYKHGDTNVNLISNRPLPPKLDAVAAHKNMSRRLARHNERVVKNSFEYRLASHGRDTGKWVDVFTQRKDFMKNDATLMTGVVVTVERDLQFMQADLLQKPPMGQQDPRLVALSEQFKLKHEVEIIRGYVVSPVNSWLHGKYVTKTRQDG